MDPPRLPVHWVHSVASFDARSVPYPAPRLITDLLITDYFPYQPLDPSNNRLIVFNVRLHGKHSAFIDFCDLPRTGYLALR